MASRSGANELAEVPCRSIVEATEATLMHLERLDADVIGIGVAVLVF